jgi:hypothetical protein
LRSLEIHNIGLESEVAFMCKGTKEEQLRHRIGATREKERKKERKKGEKNPRSE